MYDNEMFDNEVKILPKAQLDSGRIAEYDEASLEGYIPETPIQGTYIGSGIIHELNGKKQVYSAEYPPQRYDFYIYKKGIYHGPISNPVDPNILRIMKDLKYKGKGLF